MNKVFENLRLTQGGTQQKLPGLLDCEDLGESPPSESHIARGRRRLVHLIEPEELSDLRIVDSLLQKQSLGILSQSRLDLGYGTLVLGVRAYDDERTGRKVAFIVIDTLGTSGAGHEPLRVKLDKPVHSALPPECEEDISPEVVEYEFQKQDRGYQAQVFGAWNSPEEYKLIVAALRAAIELAIKKNAESRAEISRISSGEKSSLLSA